MFLLVAKWFLHPMGIFCTHLELCEFSWGPRLSLVVQISYKVRPFFVKNWKTNGYYTHKYTYTYTYTYVYLKTYTLCLTWARARAPGPGPGRQRGGDLSSSSWPRARDLRQLDDIWRHLEDIWRRFDEHPTKIRRTFDENSNIRQTIDEFSM